MIRIAVCDDERESIKQVSRLIKDYLPDSEIKEYTSGNELLSEGKDFDILFLDVQGEGMQTARKIREKDEEAIIIFITEIKEYVFDAFDVAAFHYLLKPVKEEKLKEVLKRALKKLKKNARDKNCLLVRQNGKNITVNTDDIVFLENEKHKIVIHTVQETFCLYGTMSELEKEIGAGFFRCHRGYLVNMAYISEYDKENIYLTNGERIYLAKAKYPDFVKSYMDYIKNGGISHA